jgi:hypothetical protein
MQSVGVGGYLAHSLRCIVCRPFRYSASSFHRHKKTSITPIFPTQPIACRFTILPTDPQLRNFACLLWLLFETSLLIPHHTPPLVAEFALNRATEFLAICKNHGHGASRLVHFSSELRRVLVAHLAL